MIKIQNFIALVCMLSVANAWGAGFMDDFDRPDGDVGNGWAIQTDGTIEVKIVDNEVLIAGEQATAWTRAGLSRSVVNETRISFDFKADDAFNVHIRLDDAETAAFFEPYWWPGGSCQYASSEDGSWPGWTEIAGSNMIAGEYNTVVVEQEGSMFIITLNDVVIGSIANNGLTKIGSVLIASDADAGTVGSLHIDNVQIGVVIAGTAKDPSPVHDATDVPRDTALSWAPSPLADTHNVYFGDNFDDVNNADTTNTLDVLFSPGQTATTYDPDGLLEFGQTYYWRIDEVNAPPDSATYKGDVWSFTVEPYSNPIGNVTATSSSSSEGMGPEKTVDSSGLNASDQHSTEAMDMWLSNFAGPQPTWIQYEFDRAYKLNEMWVWNSNQSIEASIGFGAKDVTIDYSEDGAAWTVLGDVELAQATGQADYTSNTTVDLGGVLAKYVRMNVSSNWSTFPLEQFGLSEVRFFYIPVQAREPKPASREADVALDVVLEWRAGREAASHEVSFSSDKDAVINGTAPVDIATENRYEPSPLEFGQIYYWKVNEVNEAASPSSWEGDVWSFSTTEYFVVDDFELYNDLDPDDPESNRIFNTWIDGWDMETNGSIVGYDSPPFTEQTIVHGGSQSMPYSYDNNFKYSEAVMTLSAARNWTQGGATKLSLWFYGDPNNAAERIYFALNDSASVYHDDPGATQKDAWTEWTIDLQEFAAQGVNLTNVNTIAIGFGDKNNLQPGGPGKMYFDDIRVGHPIESVGLVAYYPLDEGAGTTITDASGNGHDGTLTGDGAEWVESQEGYGSALKFPGDVAPGPFVNTGIWNPSERTGELTVAVWIKWEGLNGYYQGIVGKRDSWTATDTYWGLELNVDSGNIGFSRWDNYPWFGDNIPPVGEWQHIAVTFDGTTTIMYIDGAEVGRDTGFSFGAGENAGVVFGTVETSGSNPFNGTIDEVRLYDTALSADEILELAGR